MTTLPMTNQAEPSNEAKHTPEPWKISNYRPYGIIHRDQHDSTYTEGDDKFPFVDLSSPANARRIVACVNVCVGLPIETIECLVSAKKGQPLDYLALTGRCLELETVLRPIAAAYPDDPGTSDIDDEQPVRITLGDVRRAWAALAKVSA